MKLQKLKTDVTDDHKNQERNSGKG